MKVRDLTPEQNAMIGLGSVGKRAFYRHPAQIVYVGCCCFAAVVPALKLEHTSDCAIFAENGEKVEQGARGFELSMLEALVTKNLAYKRNATDYALTPDGALEVHRIFMGLSE